MTKHYGATGSRTFDRRRRTMVCLSVVAAIALGGAASAQLSISSGSEDEPRLMCKAHTGDEAIAMASGEVANNPEAKERFAYHARKYGEEIGKDIYIDCVDFENISPDYRNSFEPGGTYDNYKGEPWRVVRAPFLPANWESTPTPAEKTKRATKAKSNDTATPSQSASLAAEERARLIAERKAEYQRKVARYEQGLADHKRQLDQGLADHQRQVDEFKRAEEEIARTKQAQRAAAEAAQAAHRKLAEAHAETVRRHQQDLANQQAQVARGSSKQASQTSKPGTGGRFQATGLMRDTREIALTTLTNQNLPGELTDIKCDTMKVGGQVKWTCWGYYYYERKSESTSAQ